MSGGADSTALLVALARIAPEFELTIVAAHLNHGVRGAEGAADLARVRSLCERLAIPLHADERDGAAWLGRHGVRGEDGLRRMRLRFLDRASVVAGAIAIATAHTADDQLETLLMRLARGTGLRGLGGMTERRGRWIKPLLGATRAAVVADLTRAGLAWCEDSSNQTPGQLRNRIRIEVVPALVRAVWPEMSRLSPTVQERILLRKRAVLAQQATAAAAEVRSAHRSVRTAVRRLWPEVCRLELGEVRLDATRVVTQPLAFRRAFLRETWARFSASSQGLTRRHLDLLDGLLGSPGRSRVDLPGGVVASRERNGMLWSRPPTSRTAASRRPGR